MQGTAVGIRELKNRLSEYLRRVKEGETIVVTERGRPVGRIVPIPATLGERVGRLAQSGILEWSGETLLPYQPKAVNRSDRLLSDLVAEERG